MGSSDIPTLVSMGSSVINFKTPWDGINRGMHKLIQTPTIIKKFKKLKIKNVTTHSATFII